MIRNVLLAVLIGFCAAGWASGQEKAPTDYYPLKVGAEWHYDATLASKDAAAGEPKKVKIVVRASRIDFLDGVSLTRLDTLIDNKPTISEHLQVMDTGVFRHRANQLKAVPPFLLLQYPVKKGASWKNKVDIGGQSLESTSTLSEETVEVPHGKHENALKLTVDGTVGGMPLKTTYWFSKGVGIVKQTADIAGVSVTLQLEKYVDPNEK